MKGRVNLGATQWLWNWVPAEYLTTPTPPPERWGGNKILQEKSKCWERETIWCIIVCRGKNVLISKWILLIEIINWKLIHTLFLFWQALILKSTVLCFLPCIFSSDKSSITYVSISKINFTLNNQKARLLGKKNSVALFLSRVHLPWGYMPVIGGRLFLQ